AGEHRHAGGDEDLGLDRGCVDVSVRADQDGVADDGRVPRPAADEGVLHHDHDVADAYLAVLRGEYGAVQDPSPLAQRDGTAYDGGRRDVCGAGHDRPGAAVFDQHRG